MNADGRSVHLAALDVNSCGESEECMPRAGWVTAWLILFQGISVLSGAERAFEYPSALLDEHDADQSCWVGMGLDGEYPVTVVPSQWLVGPPPSQHTAVTMPNDHWLHLLFSGEIVSGDGSDIEIVETGSAGEQALVFLTDGADQEYALGIAQSDGSGSQVLTFIGMELGDFPAGFVPRGLRLVALDRGGAAPGFDVANVRAWVSHERGPTALYPDPVDGAVDVPFDATLRWLPACGTDVHTVYFSTDSRAVRDCASEAQYGLDDPDIGRFEPPRLQLGQTYYWRVADANSADANDVRLSGVWSFSAIDRISVDDFEAYGGQGPSISTVWRGRDWGLVSLESGVFRSCAQSLGFRYYYDNYYDGVYSEVYRVFDQPQDWTQSGVEMLEFWLYGNPSNSTSGQMYVAVSDGITEQTARCGSEVELLTTPDWQACRIPLANYTEVNLARVSRVGLGLRRPLDLPQQYGSGTVYIDDVGLRPTLCLEDHRSEADLTADCAVDYRDLDRMASAWLASRAVVSSVASPNDPVLWYKFDGDAFDSAGSAHGQVEGRPTYVQGRYGQAISFAGAGDSISVSQVTSVFGRIREAMTISFWQYGNDTSARNDTICCSNYVYGQSNPSIAVHLGCWSDSGQYRWDCGTPWSIDNRVAGRHGHQSEWAGRWNHWAFIKDSAAGKMEIYLNGILYDRRTGTDRPIEGITSFEIGSGWYGRYDGLIDDFRIYDYALAAQEVAFIASDGTGRLEQATAPPADLDGSGRVDLGDYAILAAQWLDDQRWP
jgi:hypothetical protein